MPCVRILVCSLSIRKKKSKDEPHLTSFFFSWSALKVVEEYFILSSFVLSKKQKIYDCLSAPLNTVEIIDALFQVMTKGLTPKLLEEEPLSFTSSQIELNEDLAKSDDLNAWVEGLFALLRRPSDIQVSAPSCLFFNSNLLLRTLQSALIDVF